MSSLHFWASFGVSAVVVLCAGTLYGFGAYSEQLADTFGQNIDIIGSCGDIGVYTGVIMGVFSDKFGVKKGLAVSTILLSVGYFAAYQIVNPDGFLPLSVPLLGVFYYCIGQGSFGFLIACLTAAGKSFSKENRTKTYGFFLCMYALSSIIFTLVFEQVNDSHLDSFFLTMTGTVLTAGLLGVLVVRKFEDLDTNGILEPLANNAVTAESYHPYGDEEYENDLLSTDEHANAVKTVNSSSGSLHAIEDVGEVDITGAHLFSDASFWTLFALFFCYTGPCLMFKNTIGSIGKAFYLSQTEVDSLVYGWSSFNAFFRVTLGLISDYYSTELPGRRYVSRPAWLILGGVVGALTHFGYVFYGADGLWAIVVGTAFVYAAAFAIVATEVSLFFGTTHYGFNMGIMSLAPAVSGTVYTAVAGWLYTGNAIDGEAYCYGKECFTVSFVLSAITLAAGVLISVYAVKRSKDKMKSDNLKTDSYSHI
jgi:MFS family permease